MAIDTDQGLRGLSLYQVFIRNYSETGDFAGALPALDEAKRLGFDFIYICPIHPIGRVARKGSLGSPYAISDYRRVDPALGGEAGFRSFLDAAHEKGLRLLMDVVYNHTSPDSRLALEHPEWFWRGPSGRPAPRIAEWSDVVDLDYAQRPLWDYQIETLEQWARFGVDGFRCDVASLVPVAFWVEARRRVAAIRPCLWLAESVHKEFVAEVRAMGHYAACDAELHEAFDLTYDYDGREELESAWSGRAPLSAYLKHLFLQQCMYPATAIKARFLENHDQARAAARFGGGARLRNWSLFAMLLDGLFFAYAGEERAIAKRPSLFDKDVVDLCAGDPSFERWFEKAHKATKAIRAELPLFSVSELAEGLVLVRRSGGVGKGGERKVTALLNLDGRSGKVLLPETLSGRDILSGAILDMAGRIDIPLEALLISE